jgi:sulfate transport system substrate-binding protein
MRKRSTALLAVALVGALALAACGGDDSGSKSSATTAGAGASTTAQSGTGATPSTGDGSDNPSVNLSLVAYSVPQTATKAAEAAFAKTPEGKNTSWTESYGASGDQSRAVVSGLKADYVHFSLEGDVTRLVQAGLVADDWNKGPNKGIVSRSVVVIATRKGNPKHITGWDDLVKPGIGIITPNPGSSGSARWNILAAYGHVLANGGTDAQATDYLKSFFANVVSLPGSGRDATTAFLSGTGDVLISYENEAILARQQNQDIDYFIPDTTILIENPGAVTKTANPRAAAWLAFVLGKGGQTEFVKKGFRPVGDVTGVTVEGANDPKNPFPAPAKKLQTITDDFGGWSAANTKFFDANNGIVTIVQKDSGKS